MIVALNLMLLQVFVSIIAAAEERLEGQNITINCGVNVADVGSEKIESHLVWQRWNGERRIDIINVSKEFDKESRIQGVLDGRAFVTATDGLVITDLKVKDTGAYVCLIANNANASESDMKLALDVNAIPDITVEVTERPSVNQTSGYYAAAICQAHRGKPPAFLQWVNAETGEVQDSLIANYSSGDGTFTVRSVLLLKPGFMGGVSTSIESVTEKNQIGHFTCIASHKYLPNGAIKETVAIWRLYAPCAGMAMVGGDLACFALGNPLPTVSLTLPNGETRVGLRNGTQYISLSRSSLEGLDGKYVCVAENSIGWDDVALEIYGISDLEDKFWSSTYVAIIFLLMVLPFGFFTVTWVVVKRYRLRRNSKVLVPNKEFELRPSLVPDDLQGVDSDGELESPNTRKMRRSRLTPLVSIVEQSDSLKSQPNARKSSWQGQPASSSHPRSHEWGFDEEKRRYTGKYPPQNKPNQPSTPATDSESFQSARCALNSGKNRVYAKSGESKYYYRNEGNTQLASHRSGTSAKPPRPVISFEVKEAILRRLSESGAAARRSVSSVSSSSCATRLRRYERPPPIARVGDSLHSRYYSLRRNDVRRDERSTLPSSDRIYSATLSRDSRHRNVSSTWIPAHAPFVTEPHARQNLCQEGEHFSMPKEKADSCSGCSSTEETVRAANTASCNRMARSQVRV